MEDFSELEKEAKGLGLEFPLKSPKEVTYFKSYMKSPLRMLSNFQTCILVVEGITFGSSEAAYQCLTKFPRDLWALIGELSCIESVEELIKRGLLLPAREMKRVHESFRDGQRGLLWKYLSYTGSVKQTMRDRQGAREGLQIGGMVSDMPRKSLKDQVELWDKILGAKFAEEGTPWRRVLESVSIDRYIVEMGSMGKGGFWNGTVKKDGTIVGFNFMGRMMMRHRRRMHERGG